MITLASAQRIADAAFEAAEAAQAAQAAGGTGTGTGTGAAARLAVVVTDSGGDIRAALRADTLGAFAIDIAHAKAQSALGFNMSTLRLAGFFGSNAASTIGIAGATAGRFVPIGGGVVVVDESGRTLGAAAVAGGLPAADDALVRQAVAAAGLQALP